jgi:hypothetical protein
MNINNLNLPILIFILLIMFLVSLLVQEGLSISPSFNRRELPDEPADWYSYLSNGSQTVLVPINEASIQNLTGTTLGNIGSVSYVSDGKTLEVTLWLVTGSGNYKNSFEEKPLEHDPIYGISVDVDSNLKTGRGGIDYGFAVDWNNSTKQWEMFSFETSRNGNSRILDSPKNFTGFDEVEGYITIPIDLSRLNNPDQYVITFFVLDSFANSTQIHDTTNWVNIPPPLYSISTSPSQISLRPGDERPAELRIKQIGLPTHLQPNVTFSANQPKALSIRFFPNQTGLPVNEAANVMLHINTSYTSLTDHSYIVPIYANITYPGEYLKSPGESILQVSNLTVTVLPNASIVERIQQFNNDWIAPISNIWTFFLGVGATVVAVSTWTFRKKKQSKKQNKLDGRWT